MPFVQVRDLRVYYEIQGAGPRLVYFNGTGGDLRRRPSIFDSALAKQFEILAFDQRGLGQTSRPDIPYSMQDYAEDANALLDAIGWDACFVFGVSFGGMVAQEFSVRFPHRVKRLILACTSGGGAGGASFPLQDIAHLTLHERARWFVSMGDTRRDSVWQKANAALYQTMLEQLAAGLLIGADEPGRAAGAQRQLDARLAHDCYDRLPSLIMPVLICGGRYDGICPVENLTALQRQIPHSTLALFDGGHSFFLQDARAFNLMIEFLLAA